MLKINPIFQYTPLKRIQKENGRHYFTPNGLVPSVTTILGYTGDKSSLHSWISRIGKEEANRQTVEASNIGSLVHKHIECAIRNLPRPQGKNIIHVLAKQMSDKIIENHLQPLNEVWGIESPLYYPELYAGTADCIGVYNGFPSILDFKTAKKIKKIEHIEDYFIQLAMYILAHNELYKTNIKHGVILMVSREGETKKFLLDSSNFNHWASKAYYRINEYYQKFHHE